jgi:hypothetical protein
MIFKLGVNYHTIAIPSNYYVGRNMLACKENLLETVHQNGCCSIDARFGTGIYGSYGSLHVYSSVARTLLYVIKWYPPIVYNNYTYA